MDTPIKRPAWSGMGFWKWPAILLLVFCIGMIAPYAMFAGGTNDIGEAPVRVDLAGCAVAFSLDEQDARTVMNARIDPACARDFSAPLVRIRDGADDVVWEGALKGNPNAMRASFPTHRTAPSDRLRLEIAATHADGAPVAATWPFPQHTP